MLNFYTFTFWSGIDNPNELPGVLFISSLSIIVYIGLSYVLPLYEIVQSIIHFSTAFFYR